MSVRANLVAMPVADGAVEAVVSMQVVEHVWDQPAFITECARVLRPAGTLIVSTPNRRTFSAGPAAPVNPFHTRELDAAELTELLAPAFAVQRMLGVSHGRRLRRVDRRFGGLVAAQLAGPVATWHPALRRAVAEVTVKDFTVTDFTVTDRDVDRSLDLIAVAVRRP